MMSRPRKYPQELLERGTRLVLEPGRPIAHVARDLGVPAELLRKYVRQNVERALRDMLGYRLYPDLERGRRITALNLAQCGLLKIEYMSLDELCGAEDVWEARQPTLVNASAADRQKIATVLLDLMRRELAVRVDYLSGTW